MAKTTSRVIHEHASMEEKILAAAEKLFFENGYDLTSTTQIAKQAGCNQALVHYYFRTKEKLFQAVLGGKVKEVFRRLITLENAGGDFKEKLTRLIELHYDIVRENSGMVLFLISELTRNPDMFESLLEEVGDLPRQTLALFQKDLEEEIAAGRIREIELPELVISIVSLNVFPFVATPIFTRAWGLEKAQVDAVLDNRKKEIVKTVLLSLRPI